MGDWCRYCGEEFRSLIGRRYVLCEGECYPIHSRHYVEYWERGRLPYRDGPRRGIVADEGMDLIVIGVVAAVWVILIVIVPRLAEVANLTMPMW